MEEETWWLSKVILASLKLGDRILAIGKDNLNYAGIVDDSKESSDMKLMLKDKMLMMFRLIRMTSTRRTKRMLRKM
jgi:hypothetical protein